MGDPDMPHDGIIDVKNINFSPTRTLLSVVSPNVTTQRTRHTSKQVEETNGAAKQCPVAQAHKRRHTTDLTTFVPTALQQHAVAEEEWMRPSNVGTSRGGKEQGTNVDEIAQLIANLKATVMQQSDIIKGLRTELKEIKKQNTESQAEL